MIFDDLGRKLLLALPPETAHNAAVTALKYGIGATKAEAVDDMLSTRIFGLDFPNPVGLAAGFDKNAECMKACLHAGFGFVEVGTVTPKAQPGNAKPRLFRLQEDEAVINRFGFNSAGIEPFLENMRRFRRNAKGIVGINVGINKSCTTPFDDYAMMLERAAPYASYLTINISSPNTAGLRALQEEDALETLLDTLSKKYKSLKNIADVRMLVKIAPDVSDKELTDIVRLALRYEVDGLILTNTTIARPESLKGGYAQEKGGLSGKPLFELSTEVLRKAYRLTEGNMPLVGVGGIASGEDAYAKIRAGASLVQLYTALVYQGLGLVQRINTDLVRLLKRDGFTSVAEAVGVDAAQGAHG